jgi:prolyl-tRNA editing enzyme YbaK/EbsC (Cys-tRNA(Pro) deacylase)
VQRVLIDPSLLGQELLWAGAGSPSHLLALPPAELVRLSRAEQAEIAVEAPR